ncbi:MAG: protein kinase [Myxococcaceae bacterium]|nr:protein kinase [Myxococcaceae bacterium]
MNERYRLVRPLASGGMAELHLGIARGAEGFEKHVAIKRVLPYLAKDEGVTRMFLSEARLATHLQHQNLVSVYDVGSDAGGPFLVMELVNGWDLGVLIRRVKRQGSRFPPHLVAFIGAQVLAGLVHAYRRTHNGRPVLTAHRDISPSNILVSREGEVKVTDFGIARLEGVSNGTQPGVFKGKPAYAAPEVITGAPATATSDQFSLGIVLYELLTGQHPFSESSEAIIVAMAIASGVPPPLTGVPEPLAEVVMRALEKKPEARFPQPEAMAEALARYLARAGEPATSHALAAFLAGQGLPPTLLEQGETAGARAPAPAQAPPPAPPSPQPPAQRSEPEARPPEPSSEWAAPPGSAALSTSGRLIPSVPTDGPQPTGLFGTPPGPRPQPSATAQASLPQAAPSPQASATFQTAFRCVRCEAPLPSAHAPCDRCALELTSRRSGPLLATPSVLETPAEQLELEARGPREETLWRPRRRFAWGRWALRLAVLGALVAGGLWAWPRRESLLPSAQQAVRGALTSAPSSPPPLIVGSEPTGARVRVNGQDMGTTPLVMDNDFPPGEEIPLEVTLRGYKPWKSTFIGSAPAQFEVELEKR